MPTVTIEEAKASLGDLIHQLQPIQPNEEIVITENNQPVARLVATASPKLKRRLGTLKGTVLYMAPDFDAPLDDLKEHME